jgi:hypothetical protein
MGALGDEMLLTQRRIDPKLARKPLHLVSQPKDDPLPTARLDLVQNGFPLVRRHG